MNKNVITVFLTVLFASAAIVGASYAVRNDFFAGNDPETPAVGRLSVAEVQAKADTYIRENIVHLSPEEAVLGGTWYVTSLEFTGPDTCLVDYEDGHIALQATATFIINSGEALVTSFELNENRDEDLPICVDNCGNGVCEEMVCMGQGCPCAESVSTCPEDCA
jgi:hypothetical protein